MVLVPDGAKSLRLCRYQGLNPAASEFRLTDARLITARATIARLTHEFDLLPALAAVTNCPFDDGSAIIAIFSYPQEPSVPLKVGLNGCRVVSNGSLTRTASSPIGAKLLRELTRLAP